MQKTVLIGVTGCIAAYKSAEIVRALQKRGLRVKVVMTEHATHFVDPLTFRSLTHEPVAVDPPYLAGRGGRSVPDRSLHGKCRGEDRPRDRRRSADHDRARVHGAFGRRAGNERSYV